MTPTYLGDIELNEETLAHYGVKGMKWHIRKAKGKALELRAKGLRKLKGIKDPTAFTFDVRKSKDQYAGNDGRNTSKTARPSGKLPEHGGGNNGYSDKAINSNFYDRTGHHPGLTKDITNSYYKNGKYKKKKK